MIGIILSGDQLKELLSYGLTQCGTETSIEIGSKLVIMNPAVNLFQFQEETITKAVSRWSLSQKSQRNEWQVYKYQERDHLPILVDLNPLALPGT